LNHDDDDRLDLPALEAALAYERPADDEVYEYFNVALLPYPQAMITLQNGYWRSSTIRGKITLGIIPKNVIRAISFSTLKADTFRRHSV
jgi:hypothetical protein